MLRSIQLAPEDSKQNSTLHLHSSAELEGMSGSLLGLQGVNMKFVPLQEGMLANVYSGNGYEESSNRMFNDSNLVHFSCVLQGVVEAKIKGGIHMPSIGQGLIGFAPGENLSLRNSADFRQAGVLLTPEILPDLLGIESEYIIRDIERG